MEARAHIIVSGMVQGVGYRYFVERQARSLGLGGWVRNLPNREVEIQAQGDRSRIEILIQSLWTGNPYATVNNVQVNWLKVEGGLHDFEIVSF
jgi:acylphosphatase